MALTSKNIQIGSGALYVYAYDETAQTEIPTDATLEVEANRLGHIKGGATVAYEATFYSVKDDLGLVGLTALTDEVIRFTTGIITWVPSTLAKLCTTATVDTDSQTGIETLKLGGASHYVQKKWIVRFVSQDGKKRVTLVGEPAEGFEFAFNKEQETSINCVFTASPMKSGYSLLYEDKNTATS